MDIIYYNIMNIIVAACKHRGIGLKNNLPWKLKNEMKYFKNMTQGNGKNAVVMGKNTWLSLKKALPKRDNFVMSTTVDPFVTPHIKSSKYENFVFLKNIKEISNLISLYDTVWIIGGEKLYKSTINNPNLKAIYYTDIKNDFNCDTFFPEIPQNFIKIYESRILKENNIIYTTQIFKNNTLPNVIFKTS